MTHDTIRRSIADMLGRDEDRPILEPPIERLLVPFREFMERSASGGILLVAAALLALGLTNSPLGEAYARIWQTPLGLRIGDLDIAKPLLLWVNDGLMAIFFFVVGLEIKREALVGELAAARSAALPVAGAVGGAVVPAAIFLAIVGPSDAARGWGIPMATDIAFALGALALLGRRVPIGLKVFVTALAIVDDILAVVVIAAFYTSDLVMPAIAAAGAVIGILVVFNRLGVRHPFAYGTLGLVLWAAILASGVHATIAGVILALTVPSRVRLDTRSFVAEARGLTDHLDRPPADPRMAVEDHHGALWELETITERAQAPMLRMEHALQPWVAFLIVPLFALANAGVPIGSALAGGAGEPIVAGVFFGLVVGKQIGIVASTWLVVRLGVGALPAGVRWGDIYGAACLCGIGFTMSLFIADLAYADAARLDLAKVGILGASIVAGVIGFAVLRLQRRVAHT
jgi:NhaA family Na+:H+ antiporter